MRASSLAQITVALSIASASLAMAADPAALCQANKIRAVAAKASALFVCHSNAAATGTPVSSACVATANQRFSAAFGQAEDRGGCQTMGDAVDVAAAVDAGVLNVMQSLRPTQAASPCISAKVAATAKSIRYLLTAYAKDRKTPRDVKLSGATARFLSRLTSRFTTIEATQPPCPAGADAATISKRLNLIVSDAVARLWPSSLIGLTVTFPPAWSFHAAMFALTNGDTLSTDNFGGQYEHGGIIPPGGASITISREPLPATPISAIISDRTDGSSNISTSPAQVGGNSGIRVSFADIFDGGISLEVVIVYVAHGPSLYKFVLHYETGEPEAATFVASFNDFLASVTFVN